MRRRPGLTVIVVICVLSAVPLPTAANGGHQPLRKQATFGGYNVTYFSSKGLTGGERLNAGWQVQHVETGANYTENTTATFTFRDAGNATISETTINATRFRGTEFLVSPVRLVDGARWMDAALAIPNATATFGQPIASTGEDGGDGGDGQESTPLPAAVAVTALAAAWWLKRR